MSEPEVFCCCCFLLLLLDNYLRTISTYYLLALLEFSFLIRILAFYFSRNVFLSVRIASTCFKSLLYLYLYPFFLMCLIYLLLLSWLILSEVYFANLFKETAFGFAHFTIVPLFVIFLISTFIFIISFLLASLGLLPAIFSTSWAENSAHLLLIFVISCYFLKLWFFYTSIYLFTFA